MSNYIKYLSALSRKTKVVLMLAMDATLIALSFVFAMLLRLENLAFLSKPEIWLAMAISVATALIAFRFFGLYRAMLRYITGRILIAIGKGAIVSAIVLYGAGTLIGASLPRSVPIIFIMFVFLSVGGLRFITRTFFRTPNQSRKRPVIIYGAGDSGLQLLNSLFHGRDYAPVALVDDNPALQNLAIGGLSVDAPDQIPKLIRETGASVILLAIQSLGRARRRDIVNSLKDLQVEIKTIPGMSEIISGEAKISELRTVSAEDLLGRDPVAPDVELLGKNITGRVVMVSGAGGSIGSELCRQILRQNPTTLVLFEVSEFALYTIEAELAATAAQLTSTVNIVPVLGSVQHSQRLEAVIKAFNVQTIFHAAAYKHVPLVEENVVEGIRNNVFGTLAITRAAAKLGVENFILISTDKAVRPTNIMGASKRVAELICQAHAQENSATTFSMVRFGNVLGSSGSVIPLFRTQIENGGPITITHQDITRYFMTIPEASQLVIQAGAMGKGGDVFVLDMGEPVKILELAMNMVKLHGLTPYLVEHPEQLIPDMGDIPICITGLRKGEKLYEELLIGNNPAQTQHPRIMTASEASLAMSDLVSILDRLLRACERFELPEIVKILDELPLDYAPLTKDIFDLIWDAEREKAGQTPTPQTEDARA
ncbi:nucleoside-diphosphate sugar epimerase/dehydratase [Celeribacter marinus]|uniref:polysaccharide biosynthesis protein n=1 Tax=Celeribacter marinus TaxID=1397108 RepID=UPI00317EEB13